MRLDELWPDATRCGGDPAHGGLLEYGQARARRPLAEPSFASHVVAARNAVRKDRRARTTADGRYPCDARAGDGGFVRADCRFIHEYYTGMCAHMLHARSAPRCAARPGTIVAFEDHLSYVHRSPVHVRRGSSATCADCRTRTARSPRAPADRARLLQQLHAGDAAIRSQGISHAMMAERYALPGQLIVGTDSHTPHSGALGCVAFGVGTTDMANAFVTGAVRLTVPQCCAWNLDGPLPAGVTPRTSCCTCWRCRRSAPAPASARCSSSPGTSSQLATDERATLTNMTAELGGFTGIVEPDAETVRFSRNGAESTQ
jgi:3-isopropylmalate/(R)-2-methylmalate dehydratase large subunit